MRLRRIEIENFKSIGKRQTIHLKPITLLFGPNSAGKSTILQALHYVREVLERQNADPDRTIAGGPIDLGGFKTLVHNHELDRAITINLVVDLVEDQGSEFLPLNSGASFEEDAGFLALNSVASFEYDIFANLDLRYIFKENTQLKDSAIVQEVGVQTTVQWSDLLDGPYVSSLVITLDGEYVAAIESPPQKGRAILTNFNFDHPLLEHVDEEWPYGTTHLSSEIFELSRDLASEISELEWDDYRIAVATTNGALPNINERFQLELRDPDTSGGLEQRMPRVQGLITLLDEIMLGPVRIVRDTLRSMTYIGPLRAIPARGFRPQLSPDESRWAQGLAAWDLLYAEGKGDLIEVVNDWLSSEDKLRTGYQIDKVAIREVPVPSRMNNLFDRGLIEDDLGELQELYARLNTRVEVVLRDFEKSILVAPSDVGVGISQMIPIVVGCLTDGIGLLAMEQPELHIHPAMQVSMGDLLIHASSKDRAGVTASKSLLVETHSEHVMLRLLRRIRETAEGELPPMAPSLTPDALSVVYVETSDDDVNFRPLRIDKEGEFIDRWPRGFFDERAEELF